MHLQAYCTNHKICHDLGWTWGRGGGGDVSVVHADVAEEVGHGLVVVDTADGLHQQATDVHSLDLVTLHLL